MDLITVEQVTAKLDQALQYAAAPGLGAPERLGGAAMKDILVPISPGELLDKITILRIKSARMTDAAKVANVRLELRCSRRRGASPVRRRRTYPPTSARCRP